jgi:predicted nucleic acid-binding Zn finger protein
VSHGDDDPIDEDGSGETAEPGTGRERDPESHPAPDSDIAADTDATDSDTEPTDGESEPTGYAVPTETGSDAETAWLRELAEAGELTPDAVESMLAIHDDRGGRAIEAVSEGRVKQYQDFTVVVGHEDEYVVEDGGCTCKDTAYNLDPENPDDRCWHVLAVAIAERIGEVDYHEMWYSEVREFL